MPEARTHFYEAMFLFPQSAGADLQGCVDHMREILDRAGAEIVALRKWDERRLAYDIRGNKRGIYFLAYFKASTLSLPGIERDCNLSERIMRSLVIRADHMTEDQMRAADGQTQLADEIRLRATGAPVGAAAAESSAEEAPAEA